MHPYNPKLKQLSQQLRKNMTDAERLLWSKLRMKQLKNVMFSRQKPLGDFIADFYCHQAKLVIEVDGGQHFSADSIEYDKIRDEFMKNMGLTVLRFTNTDVLNNIEGVVEVIESKLPKSGDENSLNPSLKKREMGKMFLPFVKGDKEGFN